MKQLIKTHEIVYDKFPTHIAKTDNKTVPNKLIKINGNLIYSGVLHPQSRKIAVANMKKWLAWNYDFSKLKIVNYPLQIETVLSIPINYGDVSFRGGSTRWKPPKKDYKPTWDIGNYGYVWSKVFLDLLQERSPTDTNNVIRLGIIPNDNVMYIQKEGPYTWELCETLEERKLKFIIYESIEI